MTGSAGMRWTLCIIICYIKGRGSGRGKIKNRLGSDPGGFFLEGAKATFFVAFFILVLSSFFLRFWRGFESQHASQNRFLESFLGCLFGTLILEPFLMYFTVSFKAQLLENSDFT